MGETSVLNNRSAWLRHPNVGGVASMLLSIHDQFRSASKRLWQLALDDSRPTDGLHRTFQPLAQTLHHHHHAEEARLFPTVERVTGTPPQQLVTDHGELTRAISRVNVAVGRPLSRPEIKTAVAAFDRILNEHLDREEALVIPVLLELTPQQTREMMRG